MEKIGLTDKPKRKKKKEVVAEDGEEPVEASVGTHMRRIHTAANTSAFKSVSREQQEVSLNSS